ncbi:MAG: ATP-binding cassette domain-containing protein [Candidatus Electryonea clarkiae]|nr:ATP-binding cassette domain-containing protein [Candidatus Electryonea clarkiae]MDP8285128.1 ATP-binding cassette domain-containing protein [Candidatus Electryonea clarkiae]
MIQIKNLSKHYGKFPAVDDISFDVADGEILGFLGPNGAGKTTTMKVITGYYPPTAGKITVEGIDVEEDSLATRQLIGYLPESNPLYHDLTVYEYLDLIAELRQIPKEKRKERIGQMTEITSITDRLGQVIGQLSKGYRQRVGIAQAMLHDPKILILDEPTIGLDPNQIVEIRSMIKDIGQHKTVILSTHILPEVQATCDRVVVIHEGKLKADSTMEELQRRFSGQPVIDLEIHGEGAEDSEPFSRIHGIESVERLNDPEPNVVLLKLVVTADTDPRADIFRLCVEKNLTLLGMTREIRSLENIFQQLTKLDAAETELEEAAA